MLLCTLVGDVVRSSGEARNVRGDETGGLPELSGDAELLESSPPVGLDADAGALCSQGLGLLQHKASDPFPGCSSASQHSTAHHLSLVQISIVLR